MLAELLITLALAPEILGKEANRHLAVMQLSYSPEFRRTECQLVLVEVIEFKDSFLYFTNYSSKH